MRWNLTFVAVLFLVASPAMAGPPAPQLMFWGLRKGCHNRQEHLDDLLRDRLIIDHKVLVSCEGREKLPVFRNPDASCMGPTCVSRLPLSCLDAPLRVIGGEIVEVDQTRVLRMWMVEAPGGDPGTWRTAFADGYCTSCTDEDLVSRAHALASDMLKRPTPGPFSQPWPARPSFCPAESGSDVSAEAPHKVLLFDVSPKGREALALSAIRKQLKDIGVDYKGQQEVGRKETCISFECLTKLVESLRGKGIGRLLGVKDEEGKLSLWLFDGATKKTADKEVRCDDCDERGLKDAVARDAAEISQSCFDEGCRNGRRANSPPPPGACQPMQEQACQAGGALWKRGPYHLVPSAPIGGIDVPATRVLAGRRSLSHKSIYGLLWGTTVATAASAAILAGLNWTDAGKCSRSIPTTTPGQNVDVYFTHCLTAPFLTTAAFAGVGLVISLSVTGLLERERRQQRPSQETRPASPDVALMAPVTRPPPIFPPRPLPTGPDKPAAPALASHLNPSVTAAPSCHKHESLIMTSEAVVLLRPIVFQSNVTTLPKEHGALDELATLLKSEDYAKIKLCIEGHTDKQGTWERNQQISTDRAKAVLEYLVDQKGVAADRLQAVGLGAGYTIAPDDRSGKGDGPTLNRRIEFRIKDPDRPCRNPKPKEPDLKSEKPRANKKPGASKSSPGSTGR